MDLGSRKGEKRYCKRYVGTRSIKGLACQRLSSLELLVVQWVKDLALSLLWLWLSAVAWVRSLAQELPHAVGTAKK